MWTLFLLACDLAGGGPPFGGCASDDDCAAELVCVGPNPGVACGVPPQQECSSDADCGGALRCHATADTCSPDGVGSTCGMPCEAASCGDGFTCASGACVAMSCADEPAWCGAWQVCDPGRIAAGTPVHDRHHGCFETPCVGDEACADGLSCVTGYCQEGPGTCQELVAVP
jgi:hypothetical protein